MNAPSSSIVFLFSFTLILHDAFASSNQPMVIAKNGDDIPVVVSNVCEDYAQIVICNGIDSLGVHPDLGSSNCPYDPHYTHYDSLLDFPNVKFLDVVDDFSGPWSVKQMYIGNEQRIVSYFITYGNHYCDTLFITRNDTLETDSIAGISLYNYSIALIRKTAATPNFLIYDSTMSLTLSMQLSFTPYFLSYTFQNKVGVVGVDQNGETVLKIIDVNTQSIVKDTLLGQLASNPRSFGNLGSTQIMIAAQPGDSIVSIVKYNYITNVITSAIAYTGSGMNVFAWEYGSFHFQPDHDTVGTLENQVMEFNCNSMTLSNTFNIQKRLGVLSYPVDPGNISSFPYINAVDTGSSNIVYQYYTGTYTPVDTFYTHAQPSLFATDYRCAAKVSEYDDSRVQWKVYPNPSSGDFKLSASGLICGRDYDLDIIDQTGKVVYQTTVHAKMTVVLPTSDFDPGIYFVRIHTLKGFITQEIIKQ